MFHKEGYKIILISFILIGLTFLSLDYFSIQYDSPIKIFLVVFLF